MIKVNKDEITLTGDVDTLLLDFAKVAKALADEVFSKELIIKMVNEEMFWEITKITKKEQDKIGGSFKK